MYCESCAANAAFDSGDAQHCRNGRKERAWYAGLWDALGTALGLDAGATATAGSGPRLSATFEQRRTASPILQSYGTVAGPGGGTVEQGADGRWWMSYHAWDSSCTNDGCGGTRRLYVTPLVWR